MAARDDGLDKENLELIMTRLEQISSEVKEIEAGLQGQGAGGAEPVQESQMPASSVPKGQYDPKLGQMLDTLQRSYSDCANYAMK